MIPVANFFFTPNLLSVSFLDASSGVPTSWAWDFGDSGTSTAQNPVHAYTVKGNYTVILIATNTDGSSTAYSRSLYVSDVLALPVGLLQLAIGRIPSVITYDEELLRTYIATWQLYIGPLVDPPVQPADIFNEAAYAPLANVLIADLAAYNIITNRITALMAGGTSSGIITTGGNLQSIETGPAKASWHDITAIINQFFKTLHGTSPLDIITAEICSIAFRIMVSLPMCPPLPKPNLGLRRAERLLNPYNWGHVPSQVTPEPYHYIVVVY